MKRSWTTHELIDHFTLTLDDHRFLDNKERATRLGCAVLLKVFAYEGRFPPNRHDVPPLIVVHLAQQLDLDPLMYETYDWHSRGTRYHRAQIREHSGFREATVRDAETITQWLATTCIPHDSSLDALKAMVYERFRDQRLEPPTVDRIDRIVRSARRTYEGHVYTTILARLDPPSIAHLDALLMPYDRETTSSQPLSETSRSRFNDLKHDTTNLSVDGIHDTISKIHDLRTIDLPEDLFDGVPVNVLKSFYHRALKEPPREMRRHPPAIRASLLAAFCWQRHQIFIDQLVDILIDVIKTIGVRAERRVEKTFLNDIKKVSGKTTLLFHIAVAALEHPTQSIQEVIYPLVGEQRLRDLAHEYATQGATYQHQVHTTMGFFAYSPESA